MNLTGTQKSYLQTCVNSLTQNLPDELDKLTQEIKKVRQIILGDVSNPNNSYEQLRLLLTQPYKNCIALNTLSKNKISMGDIREYIFEIIDTTIINKAAHISLLLGDDIWPRQQLLEKIADYKDNQQTFKSIDIILKNLHPYPFFLPKGKIYSAYMIVDINELLIYLKITINFNPEIKLSIPLKHLPVFMEEYEYDQYIHHQIIPLVLNISDKKVTERLFEYLKELNIITQKALDNKWTSVELITYDCYFSSVIRGETTLNEIGFLNEQKLLHLKNPDLLNKINTKLVTVPSVIKHNDKDIEIISSLAFKMLTEINLYKAELLLELSTEQIKLLSNPFYRDKLITKEITLEQIKRFDAIQCANLTCSAVVKLISSNIITLNDALNMLPEDAIIINNPRYLQSLILGKLRYENIKFINKNNLTYLLDPNIHQLIIDKTLSIADINELIVTKNTNIIILITKKVITYNNLKKISSQTKLIINECPIIHALIYYKILELPELEMIVSNDKDHKIIRYEETGYPGFLPTKLSYLLKDLILLASYKLVNSSDLYYLINNIDSFPINEAKATMNKAHLWENLLFKRRCINNIKKLLLSIINNDTKHSINELCKACKMFNFPFFSIKKDLLKSQITLHYEFPNHLTFNELQKIAMKLNYTQLEIFEDIIGYRLYNIFYNTTCSLQANSDTLAALQNDINFFYINEKIETHYLYYAASKHLLLRIKSYLESQVKFIQDKYQKIVNIINATIHESAKAKTEKSHYQLWGNAIAEIFQIAKNESEHNDFVTPPTREIRILEKNPYSYLFMPQKLTESKDDLYNKLNKISGFVPVTVLSSETPPPMIRSLINK